MNEYYVRDLSVPADTGKTWNAEKEAASKKQVQSFKEYFCQLARNEGAESRVRIGSDFTGFAPPVLQVFTDETTARKLEKASAGRLKISKLELH